MTNLLKLLPRPLCYRQCYRLYSPLCCMLCCLSLAGCASPGLPSASGERARAAFSRQAITAAPAPAGAVAGIDGAAALQAQQAYRKSFAEPAPPATPLLIGVGMQK